MNKHQKESISIPVFSVLCAPAVYENPEASLQQFLNKKSEQAAAARQLICQRRWKQAAWSQNTALSTDPPDDSIPPNSCDFTAILSTHRLYIGPSPLWRKQDCWRIPQRGIRPVAAPLKKRRPRSRFRDPCFLVRNHWPYRQQRTAPAYRPGYKCYNNRSAVIITRHIRLGK